MKNELFKPLPKADLDKLLKEALFDQHQQEPEEVVVFRIEGQNIGSQGNFALVTGLPKAGKGKYICGFTASALVKEIIFGMQVLLRQGKNGIAYWDTEQSRHDHFQMMKVIKQLIQRDEIPSNYYSYHCRKHDPQTIIPMIEHDLQTNKNIGIVILDGLLDLIDSFNDEKQSKALVNFLKRITDVYGIFVLAVLHRSKSVDKSVGHLGSAADRAAQSVLIVEKNKELKHYILKAEYLRNADDFTPIAIFYNRQTGAWEQCDYVAPGEKTSGKKVPLKPQDYDISAHTLNLYRIFNSQPVQSYNILLQNIREIYPSSRQFAVDCIKYLTQETQMLFKTPEGYTMKKQTEMKLYIEK